MAEAQNQWIQDTTSCPTFCIIVVFVACELFSTYQLYQPTRGTEPLNEHIHLYTFCPIPLAHFFSPVLFHFVSAGAPANATMQAGLVAMRNLEAERKLLAEESTERKRRRPSQRVQKTTEHAHHFWSNVKKTQQTNLGSRIVNMHTLVEDATLHNAREARRAKITTFWVEGANYVIHPKAPKKMMWDLFLPSLKWFW